jgi:hypothetical protein
MPVSMEKDIHITYWDEQEFLSNRDNWQQFLYSSNADQFFCLGLGCIAGGDSGRNGPQK